ncbi:MAG: flagellar hook-length control protein FliK [Sulfurimonas sp.]|uniref:flagellar hook-length control protein FliK n=1 Tax=Sulfurimonas sp. TaxID=2022749 RepID=UPI00261ADC1F|nr:flagellar hook-length control protein FliK [Sulfurimonas sp.]MDD5400553.1 flagellar hook-length control protein FliK [Sulfurimonas sp.]
MINLSLNKQLDIIVPNTNKALALVLKEASPSEIETISKDKDLKSILSSLLQGSAQSSQGDKTLLELAKNNPTLKDLGNVTSTVKDLLNTLKSEKNPLPIETTLKNFLIDIKELSEPLLKEKIQNSGVFLESKLKNVQNPQVELKNLLVSLEKNIAKIDTPNAKLLSQNIKELLANPILRDASNTALLQTPKDDSAALKELAKGVERVLSKVEETLQQTTKTSKAEAIFLKETATITSKLAPFKNPQKLATHESVKEILSEDLKSILLKAGEEIANSSHPNQGELLKLVDKLSLQIDYYQLLSHLSNSSSLYLPFSWDSLEEGNINIKKDKEDRFYCDIDLKLKEYGELKLKLALYEENQINIHIYSDNSEFKNIVKENISLLRSALIESQITPKEIRIFDTLKKNSPYESSYNHIDLGFEVKA